MILHLDLPTFTNGGGLIVLLLILVIIYCLARIAARKPEPTDADWEDQ